MVLSASEENVRFSLQGSLGRRAAWALIAVAAVILCALIAPDVAAEIARLIQSISP